MTEWLIRLKGEKSDLDYLSTLCSSDWSVTEEDGGYYLRSTDFNLLTNACDVLACATHIIDVVNGAEKLMFGNFQAINVDGVTQVEEDGKRTQFIMPTSLIGIGRVGAPIIVTSDDTESSQQPGILESWIEIAKQEERVDRALVLYGSLKDNWKNLYMVLEVVEDDVGGERALIDKNWAPNGKIKLFKQTANNFLILGREARHGSAKWEAPQNPMSLEEAQSLVRDILHKWLRSKSPRSVNDR